MRPRNLSVWIWLYVVLVVALGALVMMRTTERFRTATEPTVGLAGPR